MAKLLKAGTGHQASNKKLASALWHAINPTAVPRPDINRMGVFSLDGINVEVRAYTDPNACMVENTPGNPQNDLDRDGAIDIIVLVRQMATNDNVCIYTATSPRVLMESAVNTAIKWPELQKLPGVSYRMVSAQEIAEVYGLI